MDPLAGVSSNTSAIRPSSPGPSSADSHVSRRLSWNRGGDVDADFIVPPIRSPIAHPLDTYDPGVSTPSTQVQRPYRYDFAASESSMEDLQLDREDRQESVGSLGGSKDDLTRLTSRRGEGYDDESGLSTPRSARQRPYGQDGQIKPPASPLRLAGSLARSPTVQAVSSGFRRASVRIVNIMGADSRQDRQRIEDGEDEEEHELDEIVDSGATSPSPAAPVPPLERQLVGKTLGFLGPDNRARHFMFRLLQYRFTEPIILLLIILNVVVLSVQASKELNTPRPSGYFQTWEDYVLLVLFILFTFEMAARIMVSGLILDPRISSREIQGPDPTLKHIPQGFTGRLRAMYSRWVRLLTQHATVSADASIAVPSSEAPSLKDTTFASQAWRGGAQPATAPLTPRTPRRTGTLTSFFTEAPFESAVEKQKSLASLGRPFLRHSWHRVDLVAVVSFWIMFLLSITHLEIQDDRHIFIFRALSVLRAGRLLVVTSGTMTILRSLKRAGPMLVRVSAFVIFALVLFSIIGVQAFRGGFRRVCMYTDPNNATNIFSTGQVCGGYIDPTDLSTVSFVNLKGVTSNLSPKGYICPLRQVCVLSDSNPFDNSQSFDNVFTAAMQVIVIISVNTWAPIMYLAMDAEYYSSSLYFIAGVIVLNFWLINLFVAVVINTFKAIRSETKKSAFGGAFVPAASQSLKEQWSSHSGQRWPNRIRLLYNKTHYFWVALVLVDVVFQATKTANTSARMLEVMSRVEIAFTLAFDLEILLRFLSSLPDWRSFFQAPANNFDLFLAVMATVIQIPPIPSSQVYPWLTVFQLLRWYRVVLLVPRMKPLLDTVFGGYAGLANMVIFLFLVNYIAALFAVQLFRGDIPVDADNITFSQQYSSFLGMYQLFSSEDWTTLLYVVIENGYKYKQGIISAILLCVWFLFANFIVLQLFIAVINENFHIAEDAKRKQQVEAYIRQSEPVSAHVSWIERLNPYRLLKAKPKAVTIQSLPTELVLPLQKAVLRGSTMANQRKVDTFFRGDPDPQSLNNFSETTALKQAVLRLLGRSSARQDSASSVYNPDAGVWDDDTGLHGLLSSGAVVPSSDEQSDAKREARNRQADFIATHPGFDKTLWIFGPRHPLRRACQYCVPSAYGDRIFGRAHNALAHFTLKTVVFIAVVGSIVVIAITTPSYRRAWVDANGVESVTWYDKVEMALGAVFLVEFLIKILADGFIFAPNAYLLSVWNVFDFVILVTVCVNLAASIIYVGELSRFTRAIKGFRALRLITLFARLRDTFHVVVVAGALKIMDASVLMILYIIPFAVWGLNIFAGLLYGCNDDTVEGKVDCTGVYQNSPVDDSLTFLTPRVWSNPGLTESTWAFDSFRESILILFEIVSLEGWIDVLFSVMDITKRDMQPEQNASQWNGIFLVVYHLFGGVIILTLFVSIIIEAFNTRSGNALLTRDQRHWVNLSKFIRRQTPSHLPKHRPDGALQAWCYDRAVNKHGFWARSFTILYCIHILFLALVDFENTVFNEDTFNAVFLVFTITYAVDLLVRFYGIGLRSFRANGWNLFDVVVITGSFATTIPAMRASSAGIPANQVNGQLQKLFLVSVSLKLVQRSSALNQLFKTSVASLPAIGNLFLLWGAIFIFYAILFLEVFGLTKVGNAYESRFQDYSTLGNALLMLAFMSVGEGWNGYMHDYTIQAPRCTQGSNFLYSDCGSASWAFGLFISWNIISMYIFVNMFTGVVVESFAYVYQMPGRTSLNREDIRAYKKVWAEFDESRSGYLPRNKFVPFFRKLTGALEMRPYPAKFSVHGLLARTSASAQERKADIIHSKRHALDLGLLNAELAQVDYQLVRERRETFARVYYEAKINAEPGKGISFNAMLRMLAHHKLIDDEKALQLDELLGRKAKTERVTDMVNLDRVRSLLLSIYLRRKYLRQCAERQRGLQFNGSGVPAIVIQPTTIEQDLDTSSVVGPSTWQPITSDQLTDAISNGESPLSRLTQTEGLSPSRATPSFRHDSDGSISPVSLGRKSSSSNGSRDDTLNAMSNSMWGDMLRDSKNSDDSDDDDESL